MANLAAKVFKDHLESMDIKCKLIGDNEEAITMSWNLENTSMRVFFVFGDDNRDVQLRGMEFIRIPDSKIDQMYKSVNECNSKFRWTKFYLEEEDNEIVVECDAVIQLDSCAEECTELMAHMANIVDQAYPIFMKALYA